ncbi:uncharacterized protein LOC131060019 [Cryptomeria japonica]|uniref:uncharacterized protein LOC131060019 n=1 Tax=Cryptomeria japonica TaxID=3369 RepID=UPI0027DA2B29|nr:uncharacterized protein LOC131060019 [Cryptomeria japonica]
MAARWQGGDQKKLRPGSRRSRAAGSFDRRRPEGEWPAAAAQGGGDGGPGRRGAGAAIWSGRRRQFAAGESRRNSGGVRKRTEGPPAGAAGAGLTGSEAPVAAGWQGGGRKKLRPGSGRSRAADSFDRRRPEGERPAAAAQGGGDGGPGRWGAGAAIWSGRRRQFAAGESRRNSGGVQKRTEGPPAGFAGAGLTGLTSLSVRYPENVARSGAPVAAGWQGGGRKKLHPGSGRSRPAGSFDRRRPEGERPAVAAQGGGDGGPGRQGAGAAIWSGRRRQFAGGESRRNSGGVRKRTEGPPAWAARAGLTGLTSLSVRYPKNVASGWC